MTKPTHTLFAQPVDRLLDMAPGQVVDFPAADYWKVNARRQRAERKTGGKYSLRKRGDKVFVLRVN